MGSEHLNWILENVSAFMLKEETKTDLPSWKTDINNTFDEDLVKFEDGILLSPLVRLTYLQHLRNSLKNNYLQCQKGFKDCSDMITKRIENCAILMEQKALRLCMVASYYQRTMATIISDIKNLTNNSQLNKELGRCLCSDYLCLREDKNIQTEFRPCRLSRGVQTSDHKPWTETDLDTLSSQRITKLSRRTSLSHIENPQFNKSFHDNMSANLSPSQAFNHTGNSYKSSHKPVPNHLSRNNSRKRSFQDLTGCAQSQPENSLLSTPQSNYDCAGQSVIVKKIIDDYAASFSGEENSSVGKKAKSNVEETDSKTYDSLDDRLQALFADDPPCSDKMSVDVPSIRSSHKSCEEIMKDLLGSDDDDFPLDSQEIEELSRDLSDNEHDNNSVSQSPVESEIKEIKRPKISSPISSEIDSAHNAKLVLSELEVDPNVRLKSHLVPWLSERVAQVCYFNKLMQQMPPDKRRALEKQCLDLFGPCCMFDNDDLSAEEQEIICRKRIAKIVCHYLRPYFKSKQIGNKDLFQTIAKHITEELLNKHLAADENMARKSVQRFFEKNGKIKCIEQLPFDVKPKIPIIDAF
ncbi:unnamed protein product [Bemisia tabaci]|uniref:Set2 Rpb1 interacting domain-containing protein n=1 Tax=Bemisia tabaci TaxID=7038 RepID=A0A9P0G2H8_BEMTA|nr:unnamed protein product [Bemisia tabaci]